MRIGVNALYLIPGGVGGTEIYLRNLLRAMARIDSTHEWFVIANRETGEGLAPKAANFHTLVQPLNAVNRPARLFFEQTALARLAGRLNLDVLFNPGFTAPLFAGCPMVTVFHDLQHKRHPEYFRWFDLPAWRFFLYWAARRSRRVIAVSEATRMDLRRFYPWLTDESITVAPHGVAPDFLDLAPRRAPEKFLLCVSTLHPHKNIDRLVRVFARFRQQRPEFHLVIAGLRGFHSARIERAIAETGTADAVRLTGWISHPELLNLYRTAWAFLYPSTFEGFGMPVLEALAAGVPAAVSSIEPMMSVASEAALLFDPLDERAMEAAMTRIASDEGLRKRLASAGPERAKGFTWQSAAKTTLQVLEQAVIRKST